MIESKLDTVDTNVDTINTNVSAIITDISAAVPEPPTAKSLQDLLHKDGSFTYDNTTDSNEAIADAVAVVDSVVDTNQDYLDGTTATPNAYRREKGVTQVATTTIDLNQAAASYDLFTTTTQDCTLKSITIRLPNVDVSDDTTITSISIQTDDTTITTFINSTDGAKANLTAEAQISWDGTAFLKSGTKIQLTIAGGAADASTVCDVVAEYFSNTDGGYLA